MYIPRKLEKFDKLNNPQKSPNGEGKAGNYRILRKRKQYDAQGQVQGRKWENQEQNGKRHPAFGLPAVGIAKQEGKNTHKPIHRPPPFCTAVRSTHSFARKIQAVKRGVQRLFKYVGTRNDRHFKQAFHPDVLPVYLPHLVFNTCPPLFYVAGYTYFATAGKLRAVETVYFFEGEFHLIRGLNAENCFRPEPFPAFLFEGSAQPSG